MNYNFYSDENLRVERFVFIYSEVLSLNTNLCTNTETEKNVLTSNAYGMCVVNTVTALSLFSPFELIFTKS
jgi:hypothetical protein